MQRPYIDKNIKEIKLRESGEKCVILGNLLTETESEYYIEETDRNCNESESLLDIFEADNKKLAKVLWDRFGYLLQKKSNSIPLGIDTKIRIIRGIGKVYNNYKQIDSNTLNEMSNKLPNGLRAVHSHNMFIYLNNDFQGGSISIARFNSPTTIYNPQIGDALLFETKNKMNMSQISNDSIQYIMHLCIISGCR